MKPKKNRLPINKLKDLYCKSTGCKPFMLFIKDRGREFVEHRQAFCAFAYSQGYVDREIASFLGLERSTVTSSRKVHTDRFNLYANKFNTITISTLG